jgi:hypothetical protein
MLVSIIRRVVLGMTPGEQVALTNREFAFAFHSVPDVIRAAVNST